MPEPWTAASFKAASEVSFVSAVSEDYMNMIHTSSGINLFEEA